MSANPRFPLPDLEWEPTRGFWEAAARSELAVPRCSDCAHYVWYPAPRCPACDGENVLWESLSGRGTLFSYAVVTRALFNAYASKAPYVTALVSLEEDPSVRLVTLLVDCEPEELRMEMPVEVVFRSLEFPDVEGQVMAPLFAPVRSPGGGVYGPKDADKETTS